MSRFILRYGGGLAMPKANLEDIRSTPGVRVLDSSPKMLLVGGGESSLRETLKDMPGWTIHPEMEYPLPDTRQKLA